MPEIELTDPQGRKRRVHIDLPPGKELSDTEVQEIYRQAFGSSPKPQPKHAPSRPAPAPASRPAVKPSAPPASLNVTGMKAGEKRKATWLTPGQAGVSAEPIVKPKGRPEPYRGVTDKPDNATPGVSAPPGVLPDRAQKNLRPSAPAPARSLYDRARIFTESPAFDPKYTENRRKEKVYAGLQPQNQQGKRDEVKAAREADPDRPRFAKRKGIVGGLADVADVLAGEMPGQVGAVGAMGLVRPLTRALPGPAGVALNIGAGLLGSMAAKGGTDALTANIFGEDAFRQQQEAIARIRQENPYGYPLLTAAAGAPFGIGVPRSVGEGLTGAGIGAGMEAVNQIAQGETLDPIKMLIGAGSGAFLSRDTPLAERMMGQAENATRTGLAAAGLPGGTPNFPESRRTAFDMFTGGPEPMIAGAEGMPTTQGDIPALTATANRSPNALIPMPAPNPAGPTRGTFARTPMPFTPTRTPEPLALPAPRPGARPSWIEAGGPVDASYMPPAPPVRGVDALTGQVPPYPRSAPPAPPAPRVATPAADSVPVEAPAAAPMVPPAAVPRVPPVEVPVRPADTPTTTAQPKPGLSEPAPAERSPYAMEDDAPPATTPLAQVETPTVVPSPTNTATSRLDDAIDAANKRIEERANERVNGPLSLGALGAPAEIERLTLDTVDFAIIAGAYAAKAGIKAGKWTADTARAIGDALLKEFGEGVRKQLPVILREAERYYNDRLSKGLGDAVNMTTAGNLAARRLQRKLEESRRGTPGQDYSLLDRRKPVAATQGAGEAKTEPVSVPTPNAPDMGTDAAQQVQQAAQAAGQPQQQTEEERRGQQAARGAVPAPQAAKAEAPTAPPTTETPSSPKSSDPAVDVRRMRMEDVERIAADLGRPVPDRKQYADTWDAAKERAMANYKDITRNLEGADVRKIGSLSQEEYIVANVNLRRLTESEIPDLARQIEDAEAKGDTEVVATLKGKLDVAYDRADRYAQLAHKAGSEAGRRLALQKAFLDGPFDAATLVRKARAAAGGKLSKEATITVTRLAEKGKRIQQNVDARYQAKADAALKQMESGDWSKLSPEKIRGCL